MKKWGLAYLLALSLLIVAAGPLTANEVITLPDSVRQRNHAPDDAQTFIKWTEHFIHAMGRGEVQDFDATHHKPFQTLAKARQNAYHHLLEAAKSIQLTPRLTAAEALKGKDEELAAFESLLKSAQIHQTEFLSTGTVEVTLQFSITGKFSEMMLPDSITRLEEIESGQSAATENASEYTGLVVDARGLPVVPAMCFQVLDEDGKEVYGPAYANRENAVALGMCQYVSNIAAIKKNSRVGSHPLVVKGIKLHPPGASDIMISGTDAARLRGSVEHLAFLKKCRVIVVMD
ncbi:MAG TPA: hypothetical protein VKN73_11960 [Desulfosalsimonadaceae bacterium]|nr:hypothetical protein [Desulfosalsimonadaceae bacterium]